MYNHLTYLPVNWIDGMKISKDHFIAQDSAMTNLIHISTALNLSPVRYGILPASDGGIRTVLSVDNQNALSVTVLQCKAVSCYIFYRRFALDFVIIIDKMIE